MNLYNSTRRPITIHTEEGPETLGNGKRRPIDGTLRAIRIKENTGAEGAGLELVLTREGLAGGTGDDTPPVVLRDGTGDDTPPVVLRDGDGTSPARRRDPKLDLRNATGRALRVFVERSLPVEKVFRLLGELGTLEITDQLTKNGEPALLLRAPQAVGK